VIRVRDGVITVVWLMILTPLLVLSMAIVGLSPRHWSGVPLSAVDLLVIDTNPHWGGTRPPVMDDVTDTLSTMEYNGWVAVIGGQDGRVYIETSRLSPSLFPELGRRFRFGGGTVGVIYSPLTQPVQLLGPGSNTETWWQRMDPLGTWVTLMFGFPWQLGTVVLLTVTVWAFVVRRRRQTARGPQPMVSRMDPGQ
jgi:hypothetical protein